MSVSVIGIDLGGTKVLAGSLSDNGLGDSHIEPTDRSSAQALIDQLVALVGKARGERLDAVGIGVPSVVEFETGRVVSSVNVPLADVRLRRVLEDRLEVPVFVDNDATAAALAEAHDEQLRMVAKNLVMVTIGTGVGGGIVLGGRIYRGATGAAGEVGHTIVALDISGPVPPPTSFPQPGSLEHVAAGRALDRMTVELAAQEPRSALARRIEEERQSEEPVGRECVLAALQGDEAASRTVETWAHRVGIGIANAIHTFDPEEVVIGGGATRVGDLLFEPACSIARSYLLPGVGTRTRIRVARHGVQAGMLGAALLAAQELETTDERASVEAVAPPETDPGFEGHSGFSPRRTGKGMRKERT